VGCPWIIKVGRRKNQLIVTELVEEHSDDCTAGMKGITGSHKHMQQHHLHHQQQQQQQQIHEQPQELTMISGPNGDIVEVEIDMDGGLIYPSNTVPIKSHATNVVQKKRPGAPLESDQFKHERN
jgi:hypothetical protein